MHSTLVTTSILAFSLATLAACSSMPGAGTAASAMPFNQSSLPDNVKVPAGHQVALEAVGIGEITYECRAKAGAADTFEWAFVGPKAELRSRRGDLLGSYYGPPATWEAQDGSKVTGSQLAVAPSAAGHIPLQLVKANPAVGTGRMTGLSHIQRVATRGGVAPALPCGADTAGKREVVKYQADYIFWKAV
jgi:hypothetical protein